MTESTLLSHIKHSLFIGQPISATSEILKPILGYKRVDGMDYLITKLFRPSVTEEQMSFLKPIELIEKVISWSTNNGIACSYNHHSDTFTFYKFIPKQNVD
jgi:hypothetical protein